VIEIPLTQGKVALIDDADYPLVSQFKWCAVLFNANSNLWYAETRTHGNHLRMHRLLAGSGYDHINGSGLDNRRENLRLCSKQQNNCNRQPYSNTTSKYKGVHWNDERSRWRVSIQSFGKTVYIGRFHSEQEAALAYDAAAIQYHGDFAWLNSAHFEDLRRDA
jgi:hypothetical protein